MPVGMKLEDTNFTEPNLTLALTGVSDDLAHMVISLSHEFRDKRAAVNPWDITTLDISVSPADLRLAAHTWDNETAPFPDLSP